MTAKAGKKKSVLFVYTSFSSFVNNDFIILNSAYTVHRYQFTPVKGALKNAFELTWQFFFLLFWGWKFDIYFCWFADYHSLLPVLFAKFFRKKSYVVIGGYDVANMPELKYGSFSNPFRAFFSGNTLKFVGACFPVAEALKNKILQINPKANAETLATGFDAEKFYFTGTSRSKNIVTVSYTTNYQRYMIKGLDRFRDLAFHLPDFELTVIGVTDVARSLFEPIPPNLRLLPPAPYDEMPEIYKVSSFYAQLSRSEGLPNALCEAMLCGCIPVGTNVGDNKIAIGNAGITLDDWHPGMVAEFIRNNHDNSVLRECAREQIIKHYNKDTRQERLMNL